MNATENWIETAEWDPSNDTAEELFKALEDGSWKIVNDEENNWYEDFESWKKKAKQNVNYKILKTQLEKKAAECLLKLEEEMELEKRKSPDKSRGGKSRQKKSRGGKSRRKTSKHSRRKR